MMTREQIDAVLAVITSQEKAGQGNERVKEITNRLLKDLFYAMVDLNITSEEMWHAADYLKTVGQNNEWGLLFAGLGIEKFMDDMMDHEDQEAGLNNVTPRTIEGPLYVAGSPETESYAELENNPEENRNLERFYMEGTVKDVDGNPVEGALLEVWHCNEHGMYSYFDTSQSEYNLRRAIRIGADGKYKFKTVVPPGYSCPPGSATDKMMTLLGRHGSRPAHIHFFVTAPGYRKLTTQINIEGDPLIFEDFAFATKADLVPKITRHSAEEAVANGYGDEAYAHSFFNFTIVKEEAIHDNGENHRTRALAS
ncbi:dioxygenase [Kaistella faecalis]|uniref:dioxygenase family protein n=1 Tax=Kaistella faecalis TaxID=2852098 RepID=UPI001C493BCB|nr:dioxygenase [Chryseobacterium faecale]UFK98196.1 catechol 1,2-dioxygenase [Chryseobacterium faecale]